MRKSLTFIGAAVALPLVLAACGSTSSSASTATSPKQAIAASYKIASTQADSFHVVESTLATLNGKDVAVTTTSGNIYANPSNTSADYANITAAYTTNGTSDGSFQIMVKNNHAYFNLDGLHIPNGAKLASGWVVVSLPTYLKSSATATNQAVSSPIPLESRANLLKILLDHGALSSAGTQKVDGHLVNKYVATISVANFEKAITSSSGQLAQELAHLMEIYHLAGNMHFSVGVNSNDMPVYVNTSVVASFKGSSSSSASTYHLGLSINEQFSNYGVSFNVQPPAHAKTLTNFSSL